MTTRLYLPFANNDTHIDLPVDDAHYLLRVLRMQDGDSVLVFNETMGEWHATLAAAKKNSAQLNLHHCVRVPQHMMQLILVFAPLKNDAMSFLYEKGTELGVTHFQPILTDYAQKYNFHKDKIRKQLIAASQQSERLCIPEILDPMPLAVYLSNLSAGKEIGGDVKGVIDESVCSVVPDTNGSPQDALCNQLTFAAIERINAKTVFEMHPMPSGPRALIVGPEGGFSAAEKTLLAGHPHITAITLSRQILRAETAAIVGVGMLAH